MQATSVPRVWSQVGITTRNRYHASQAQNNDVRRAPMRGPSPQSNCSHIPGSGTHGRYGGRLPGPPCLLDLGHRPTGGALIAGETHRDDAVVHHVGADLRLGALDELLDLLEVRVDQPGPPRVLGRIQPASRRAT